MPSVIVLNTLRVQLSVTLLPRRRRKNRELKQYSKQVQAEKQKERIREKKNQISDITKLRKQRVKGGFQGELDFDKDMKVKSNVRPDKAGQRIRSGEHSDAA